MWKGGRTIDKYGYVRLANKRIGKRDKREREHRLVMEKFLGRVLLSSEIIHHIDGNKQNNAISNLFLAETNSKHQLAHSSMEPIIYKLYADGKIIFEDGIYKIIKL